MEALHIYIYISFHAYICARMSKSTRMHPYMHACNRRRYVRTYVLIHILTYSHAYIHTHDSAIPTRLSASKRTYPDVEALVLDVS